nr:hybrid sensor histidine kinase/response regulator transcription factor [Portibacter lacus]
MPKYEIHSITSSQGIASVEITKLFQDKDGFIWMGTATGISKYDGVDFENFVYADSNLIANISDIVEDGDGVIWAAGVNGLFYFDGEVFLPTTIYKNPINRLYIDSGDNLMIGGVDFIPYSISPIERKKLLKDESFNKKLLIDSSFWESHLIDRRVWEITEDDESNIWLGLDRMLGRIDHDTLIPLWTTNESIVKVSNIDAIHPDSVYWGGENLGLRKKNANSIELIMNVYTSISSRTDSSLIFLTTKDLIKIDKNGRDTLSDLKNVDNLYLREMLQDREGNLWIAAEGYLFKVSPNYFQSWSGTSNALLESNHSITQLQSGKIIIGSSKKNLLEIEGNGFRLSHEIPAAFNSVTEAITEDRNGNLWYATSMSGLILNDNGKISKIDENSGLVDKTLFFVNEDQYGRIWCGGENGISKVTYNNGEIILKNFYSNQNPGITSRFLNVVCTTENRCWAISDRDVYEIKLHSLERLPIFRNQEAPIISAAISDRNGGLLLSTLGHGIYHLEQNGREDFIIKKQWNKLNGMLSDMVLNLHLDTLNKIWTFSQNGICSIENIENEDVIRSYDEYDGWEHMATTHIDLLETKEGEMYVVGNTRITTFPIYNMPVNKVKPQVYVKEVQLFEGRMDINPYYNALASKNKGDYHLKLPYNKNFLKFNFVATSYSNNEKNKFSYKLEGLDHEWSKPTTSTSASYPGLKPGKYNFNVVAFNNSGEQSEEITTYAFRIFWPWYLKWWAIVFYVLLFSSILYTFYILQLNKKRKEDEAFKLKELNEFQSHFYTNITHEFRTPLTVILGMTQKLYDQEEILQIDDAKHDLDMIQRNSNHLLKLVNELLDISKIENGEMKLHLIQADVSTFIKYNLESLKSLAAIQGVDLVCYNEDQSLLMDYDEEKLGAIITNLVANAIKYSKKGDQIIVHLKRTLENEKPYLVIKIKDEGDGISEEDLPYIFERFYNVGNNQLEGGGTGVGLALCKELINLMSGKVEVKSRVGLGSEFIVTIPITNHAELVQIHHWNSKNDITNKIIEGQSTHRLKKEHAELALIIEDNKDVATYLMSCLENKYETIHAEDGQEGIEMALEHQPDIIICDVMMPRKNGFEVCEYLKNDSTTDHIPIILLTARVETRDKLAGYSHGADAYLTKPFSKPELFTRIDQLLLTRKKILDKLSKNGVEAFMRKKLHDPDALFVQKAIKHIQENMDNSIFGPPLLAKKLLLSESQVYRKLKSITGKSTALFIRSIRLQKAKDLLQEPDMNISEVAYEVGFTNPSWFSTAFKEEFGFTPTEMKS